MKKPTFVKHDSGKVIAAALPPQALKKVAEVLTHGAKKYARDNWRKVDDTKRYHDALVRHLLDYLAGEYLDSDSKLPHMAHLATNALFILELDTIALERPSTRTAVEPSSESQSIKTIALPCGHSFLFAYRGTPSRLASDHTPPWRCLECERLKGLRGRKRKRRK